MSERLISRRDFLRLAGLGVLAIPLAGCIRQIDGVTNAVKSIDKLGNEANIDFGSMMSPEARQLGPDNIVVFTRTIDSQGVVGSWEQQTAAGLKMTGKSLGTAEVVGVKIGALGARTTNLGTGDIELPFIRFTNGSAGAPVTETLVPVGALADEGFIKDALDNFDKVAKPVMENIPDGTLFDALFAKGAGVPLQTSDWAQNVGLPLQGKTVIVGPNKTPNLNARMVLTRPQIGNGTIGNGVVITKIELPTGESVYKQLPQSVIPPGIRNGKHFELRIHDWELPKDFLTQFDKGFFERAVELKPVIINTHKQQVFVPLTSVDSGTEKVVVGVLETNGEAPIPVVLTQKGKFINAFPTGRPIAGVVGAIKPSASEESLLIAQAAINRGLTQPKPPFIRVLKQSGPEFVTSAKKWIDWKQTELPKTLKDYKIDFPKQLPKSLKRAGIQKFFSGSLAVFAILPTALTASKSLVEGGDAEDFVRRLITSGVPLSETMLADTQRIWYGEVNLSKLKRGEWRPAPMRTTQVSVGIDSTALYTPFFDRRIDPSDGKIAAEVDISGYSSIKVKMFQPGEAYGPISTEVPLEPTPESRYLLGVNGQPNPTMDLGTFIQKVDAWEEGNGEMPGQVLVFKTDREFSGGELVSVSLFFMVVNDPEKEDTVKLLAYYKLGNPYAC